MSDFYEQLVAHKLLLPTGVDGVPGKGRVFEDVMRRFDDLITRTVANDGAEVMHFPPAISRSLFEKSGFLKSFPQLAGSIFSFTGNEAQHRELLERVQAHHPWHDLQEMTDVCLTPSACYPVYPQCAGTLPEGGRLVDIWAYCFRHEPSKDPARMQMFRMREHIRIGDPDTVLKWRDTWMERGFALLQSLGLPVKSEAASDPFFGRGGRMLAANQRDQKLKFEVLVPIASEEKPTAIMSFNYHQEHFSSLFQIKTPDGALAQTACLGFGMERCILALFATHGFVPERWPAAVRGILWP
jgi:seryl-tRNA synthetase